MKRKEIINDMMFKKCKWLTGIFCVIVVTLYMQFQSYALPYTRQGNIMIVGGEAYRENTVGGGKAYAPISVARNGDNAQMLAKLTDLPGSLPSFGTLASRAGLMYSGLSAYSSRGASSKYLIKTGATRATANSGTEWVVPPYYRYNSNEMLSFRYIGMVINSSNSNDIGVNTGEAIAGTNPEFPSDALAATNANNGAQTTATLYSRYIDPTTGGVSFPSTYTTLYGAPSGVYQLINVHTNGMYGTSYRPASGNIPTNQASDFNKKEDMAKKAFERWLEGEDGFGEAYKAEALSYIAQTGSKLSWWQVLNQFFQINGDPSVEDSTIYFYLIAGKQSGHTVYRTYSTTCKIGKNVSPTFFAIKDNESGEIIGEAYRNSSEMDERNGCGTQVSNKQVVLQYNKHYTLEGILSYYSKNQGSSATERSIDLLVLGTGPTADAANISAAMQPIGKLPDAGSVLNAGPSDGRSSGTIKASGNTTNTPGSDSYYYNGACFYNNMFTVTSEMPQTGHIILATPDSFGENGDNEVMNDDRIAIRYTISTDIENLPTEERQDDAYGDMNLGMPEYRSLHYIIEEEEESEDSGDGEGEGEEEEEPEIVSYEVYSDYGYYKNSAPADNRIENDTPQIPNNLDIWRAEEGSSDQIGDAWWEYTDRVWPDQLEDLENKCWLTDSNGTWNEDGEFLRSYSGENSFGFGFRVSRSRGKENSILSNAAVELQIYGVSPDTGDDGILLREYTENGKDYATVRTGSIGVYEYSDTKYLGVVSSAAINGIENFPRLRVVANISKEEHGESGLFTNGAVKEPMENSWEEEHDLVDRTFACEMDDMRIVEVEIKDSEGIVVYHANRYNSDSMEVEVDGYYDREEDLTMKVVVEQHVEKGHAVWEPAIDVLITGVNEEGMEESTYVNTTYTLEGTSLGEGAVAVYDSIVFRPRSAHKLAIDIEINEKHGEDMWRENIWENDDDAYVFTLAGTTADLGISQDIELYNSKHNPQGFLTFAEYLSFKFNIRHIGRSERQTAVVGGTEYNPYAKLNVKIYNADALTLDPVNHNIVYRMAITDPKAPAALIRDGDISAATRLFPGLGTNEFASHVQAWFRNYIVQSFETDTGNVAAYGHILVTANVDSFHDTNNTNVRDNSTDYVQKEFFGEKNFKIVDIGVTSRNSISEDTGISVQVALQNSASSYNDQTIVDKTYLDVYIDDDLIKTAEVEVPVGDTIVTELVIEDIELDECKIIEVRVNTGRHQTHYEYVLEDTDTSLYPDPFVDNYMSIIVCPNKPNETVCPLCIIDDRVSVDSIFGDSGSDDGTIPAPDHDNVTDTSKYIIQYEMNDGSATNKVQSINYNTTGALAVNTFRNSGYRFVNWNTNSDGSGTEYEDGAVISIGPKVNYGSDTTLVLYAQWEPITYTMSFDANGGEGTMQPINCTFDTAQSLPANEFTKEGFMFKAWNTQADGGGISIENGGSVKNFTDVAGKDVVLYAQWISESDCVILENFVASDAVDLAPGDMIAENPSLLSLVDHSTYGYMMVKIPTVQAALEGESIEGIHDLFTADWNSADWVLVYSKQADVAGEQSIYIWRYLDILAPENTTLSNPNDSTRMANRTTDLYSRLTVGNFSTLGTVHVSTELTGLVYAASGESVSPEEMAITDQIAIATFGITD